MSDVVGSLKRTVASTVGGASGATVAVLAAGAPAIWPVMLSAATAAVVEELCSRLLADHGRRAARFAEAAETHSGRTFEQLLVEAMQEEATRDLFTAVSAAAVAARDDWIIDRLALAFVAGVGDTARVDELLLVVEALRQLSPMHVRVLRLLASDSPYVWLIMGNPDPGSPKQRVWRTEDLEQADPGLRGAIEPLTGRLQTLGMVRRVDRTERDILYFELTDFGRSCIEQLSRRPVVADSRQ